MRILKSHPLLKLVNSYVIDSPQPSNISYLWNFGSLLGFCLVIQIITGVTLAMHYNPSSLEAFNSVEHIMRDVNNGWLIRYLHSNTASAFFLLVYLHIGRGLYYGSYKAPRTLVWTIGTVIFISMMATAFLGFLTIAQNDLNSTKQQNKYIQTKQLLHNNSVVKTNRFFIISIRNKEKPNKRLYSTSSVDYSNNSNILREFISEKNIKPVYVYEDLGQDSTRRKILEETRALSGVYLIINKVTKDYYIGSASTDRLHKRLSSHLINFTGSKVLKNAVKKYKIKEFAFLVLELFPDIVNQENNKKLLVLEDFYLKSLLPNYNILTEAGSSFGYKHTESTRVNMKSNYSQERRNKIGDLNKSKKLSEFTINAMKEKALNREKRMFTEKGIANMKKNSKGVIALNLDNSLYGKYASIVEAAKYFNCSVKTVSRSMKSPSKLLKKRWIVNYA